MVIPIILPIFAPKFRIMINVSHRNIELKALIEKGKSSAYRKLEERKSFLNTLRAFFFVLEIINSTRDLLLYKQYNYIKGEEKSSVSIITSKFKCILLFRESKEGKSIDILELKY